MANFPVSLAIPGGFHATNEDTNNQAAEPEVFVSGSSPKVQGVRLLFDDTVDEHWFWQMDLCGWGLDLTADITAKIKYDCDSSANNGTTDDVRFDFAVAGGSDTDTWTPPNFGAWEGSDIVVPGTVDVLDQASFVLTDTASTGAFDGVGNDDLVVIGFRVDASASGGTGNFRVYGINLIFQT